MASDPSTQRAPVDPEPVTEPRADAPSRPRSAWSLLVWTPLVLIVTYDVAFLTHEYGHSFAAWILGIKSSPWPIIWGDTSVSNMLFFDNVDENVDYETAMASGKNVAVAVVALAGPAVNVVWYLLFRLAIPLWRTSMRWLVAYTAFWFVLQQVGNFWCYVPIRVATPSGDMHNWSWGSHQSWWWLYAVFGYLVLWAIVDFYRTVLPKSLDTSRIDIRAGRALVLVLATLILFGYYAVPGLLKDDAITDFLAHTSLLLIPIVLLINWRRIVSLRPAAIWATDPPS